MSGNFDGTPRGDVWWAGLPETEWGLYKPVIDAATREQIPFAIGGGFAFSHYARRWRGTKDIDLYILRRDLPRLQAITLEAGYVDFYDRAPYDRGWIYRGWRDGVIVDLIWATANHYRDTDEAWLTRGDCVAIYGTPVRMLPAEELMWTKLFVLQRDRCDWPDLLNILSQRAVTLDWVHLLARTGDDVALLGGLLSVFAWACAEEAQRVPAWVWERVGLHPPAPGTSCREDPQRVRLLDRRDWFGATFPPSPGSSACELAP